MSAILETIHKIRFPGPFQPVRILSGRSMFCYSSMHQTLLFDMILKVYPKWNTPIIHHPAVKVKTSFESFPAFKQPIKTFAEQTKKNAVCIYFWHSNFVNPVRFSFGFPAFIHSDCRYFSSQGLRVPEHESMPLPLQCWLPPVHCGHRTGGGCLPH